MKNLFFYLTMFSVLLLTACAEVNDPGGDDDLLPREAKKLLILNEGGMGHNNSTLVSYDLSTGTTDKDYFRTVNKRGLGDTGNDMLKYGSKLYVAVNVSGTIEVIDAASGKSIRQIPMKTEGGASKEPRQLASYNGKVYVTSFDDTVTRIDTATLMIDGTVAVGQDPEGIAIRNNRIYVANSGGLNWANGYDNTVSVVDVTTFREEKKIVIGVNPGVVRIDGQGDIYVSVTGDYSTNPGVFRKIDAGTGDVVTIAGINAPGKFVMAGNTAYIINGSYGNPYRVIVYDCLNEQIITESFITDDTAVGTIHNLSVDAFSGDVFITETDYITPGTLRCFDKNGKLKYTLPAVGINPSVVVFL